MVLNSEHGLVAVDRNTVNSTLGDVSVTVGGRASVPAKVVYVHPLHNVAVLRFDPTSLPKGLVVSAAPLASDTDVAKLRTGEQVWLAGLKSGAARLKLL